MIGAAGRSSCLTPTASKTTATPTMARRARGASARNEYRQKMDAHLEALRAHAHSSGMDYYLLVTDRPLDGALREYLSIRQGRF